MLIYALLPDKGVKDFKQWRILFIYSSFPFILFPINLHLFPFYCIAMHYSVLSRYYRMSVNRAG
jgi:hypothetical protein